MTVGVFFAWLVIYILVFIFGACIGSFLNVCIYRLPKGESLIKSNSHCMTCNTPIKKRDLIPIISWCVLKGRCRSCGAKISPRYTVVESMNAVLYVLLFFYFGSNYKLWAVTCLMFSALIVVFFMDLDTKLINMYVVGFMAILGVVKYFLCRQTTEITIFSQLLGALCAGGPLLLIALITKERAMGWGDGILMLACGFFLGLKAALAALFVGLVVGCVAGLIHKHKTGDSEFAFGPWLSLGTAVGCIFGTQIANLYLSLVGLA